MVKIVTIAIATMLLNASVSAQKLMAVAGSYAEDIVLVDLKTDRVLKSIKLPILPPQGGECNSVTLVGAKKLLFSYKAGARLQNWNGKVCWDYKIKSPGKEEMQSIIQTNDGYMAAICGTPSRFVFLDKKGRQVGEVRYDSKIGDVHAQFRQVRMTANGNILLPLMGRGEVVELNAQGEQVRAFAAGGGVFAAEELSDGTLLVSGGAGVHIYSREGAKLRTIAEPTADYSFLTQAVALENGGFVLTNWQGHAEDNQPQIFILDSDLKRTKTLNLNKNIKFVSAISLK